VILIVLLVVFVVILLLWFLSLMGATNPATPWAATASPWLAFFACLILGIVVFITGSGVVVWR
jgi:hypothetical protein